jgi:hypothetical protein
MTNLTVSNRLDPGKEVVFRIKSNVYGVGASSPDIKFITPKACPRINRVTGVTYQSRIVRENVLDSRAFAFTQYARPSDFVVNQNFWRLKFLLPSTRAPRSLKPGESVVLTSSDPKLSSLNGRRLLILSTARNKSNKSLVTLRINKDHAPQGLPGPVVASGTITEVVNIVKTQRFTINVPNVIYDNLVTERSTGNPREGDVEDIVIFAFRRYDEDEDADAAIRRRLMGNRDLIDETTPPTRSKASDFVNKRSYSDEFAINDEVNIEFYITVARYIYTKGSWNGEWLQLNAAGNTIWKKATKS